jgi:hypothetical protein
MAGRLRKLFYPSVLLSKLRFEPITVLAKMSQRSATSAPTSEQSMPCLPYLTAVLFLLLTSNQASAEEWTVLFDGKDLSQWEPVKNTDRDWKVEDGILYCTGKEGWLSTKKEYDNFELELEFKLYAGANSGVFLRAPRKGNPAIDGLEIQILDDKSPKYPDLEDYQRCGGLYNCVGPSTDAAKKVGEWQTYKIVAGGRRIQVTLNGTQIIDANLDDFKKNAEQHPGVNRTEGHVGLQSHGGRVDFRNIRIKPLATN